MIPQRERKSWISLLMSFTWNFNDNLYDLQWANGLNNSQFNLTSKSYAKSKVSTLKPSCMLHYHIFIKPTPFWNHGFVDFRTVLFGSMSSTIVNMYAPLQHKQSSTGNKRLIPPPKPPLPCMSYRTTYNLQCLRSSSYTLPEARPEPVSSRRVGIWFY